MLTKQRAGYRLLAGLVAAIGWQTIVLAAEPFKPQFEPSAFKLTRGQINEVLVLGSPHLSQLPKPFDASSLRLLNERLVQWRPQAVAIESLSGVQCANLQRYPQRYDETFKTYCRAAFVAQQASGLTATGAIELAEQTLASWPAAPAAVQRRQLASLFLAAGEPGSALVQWLRLPSSERRPDDGLDITLVGLLNQLQGRGYVTYWEVRNLRMASNIREAMMPPGGRMLVVVGASHKFYLEAYLNQMHDVRIVDSDQVLRQ